VKPIIARGLELRSRVELIRSVEGFPVGTRGTVVEAIPSFDYCIVEVLDVTSAAIERVQARPGDLRRV
jgi:uncharacterized protein (DUF2461 family)